MRRWIGIFLICAGAIGMAVLSGVIGGLSAKSHGSLIAMAFGAAYVPIVVGLLLVSTIGRKNHQEKRPPRRPEDRRFFNWPGV